MCAATLLGSGCKSGPEAVAQPRTPEIHPENAKGMALALASPESALGTAEEAVSFLEGRIIGPSGDPVPGARVVLFRALDDATRAKLEQADREAICTLDIIEYLVSLGMPVASTLSGRDGWYRLDGVESGAYVLRVTRDGFAFREQEIRISPYVP